MQQSRVKTHLSSDKPLMLFVIPLSGVFFLSLVWALPVSSSIPLYGDTPEYLRLAQSLHVDQYRTVLYPFLLRTLGVIPNGLTSPPLPGSVFCEGCIHWRLRWRLSVCQLAERTSNPCIAGRFLSYSPRDKLCQNDGSRCSFLFHVTVGFACELLLHSFPGQRRLVA